jgi:hypothetical protein
MGKKYVVRLTEQELADLITKKLLDPKGENLLGNYIKGILGDKSKSGDSTSTQSKDSSSNITATGGDETFTQLDLNTTEGYNAYKKIADNFISTRSSNLLGISGSMLADAAKNAYNKYKKYVPAELALGQLASEGGFSNNPKARPIRTKNPFNVGNVDSGANVSHGSVQSGIQAYYDLIAKNYLSGNKTASDLLNNFVNSSGNRYASSKQYEDSVRNIAQSARQMSEPIYAALTKKSTSGLA